MNNRLLFVPLLVLSLFSCQQKDKGYYSVSGKLLNHPGNRVYVYDAIAGQAQPLLKDSVSLGKDGSFAWSGPLDEETILYFTAGPAVGSFASVITDAKKITLQADLKKPGEVTYTGSKASGEAQVFLKDFFNHLQAIYAWDESHDSLLRKTKLPDTLQSRLMKERKEMATSTQVFVKTYVSTAADPMLKIYALSNYMSFVNNPQMAGFDLDPIDAEELEQILTKASEAFPGNKALAEYKKNAHEQANRYAPDFTLPDVNGQPVSLKNYRGKYVLVDFWASWCGPCRMENPNVVKAWNRFKDKPNFAILGVSLDKPGEKANWLQAIKDDGLTWTHVSDLQFWNSAVVPLYKIEGIPYNVLVDPNGKIIGESLRGELLEKKLESVLH